MSIGMSSWIHGIHNKHSTQHNMLFCVLPILANVAWCEHYTYSVHCSIKACLNIAIVFAQWFFMKWISNTDIHVLKVLQVVWPRQLAGDWPQQWTNFYYCCSGPRISLRQKQPLQCHIHGLWQRLVERNLILYDFTNSGKNEGFYLKNDKGLFTL